MHRQIADAIELRFMAVRQFLAPVCSFGAGGWHVACGDPPPLSAYVVRDTVEAGVLADYESSRCMARHVFPICRHS